MVPNLGPEGYSKSAPITEAQFTLAIAIADLGHSHNWAVWKDVGKQVGTDVGLVGVCSTGILVASVERMVCLLSPFQPTIRLRRGGEYTH